MDVQHLLQKMVFSSAARRTDVMAAWECFARLMTILNSPPAALQFARVGPNKSSESVQNEINDWAADFEREAKRYRRLLVSLCGGTGVGKHIYVHLMADHIPALMRIYGDLREYSGESLEHVGKLVSQINLVFRAAGTVDKRGHELREPWTGTLMKRNREKNEMMTGHRPSSRQRQLMM